MKPDKLDVNDRVPDLLRAYRQRALLTQEDLALRTGISARTIRRLEGDPSIRPRAATLRLMATHLRLAPHEVDALIAAAGHPPEEPAGAAARSTEGPVPGRDVLPADLGDFTGRSELLAAVHDAVADLRTPPAAAGAAPTRLICLCGPAGVGKTSLAVRVAHLARTRFPDARLYLDMHGLTDQSLTGDSAAKSVLRWCGVDDARLPDGVEERAALLRGVLADRRILLVLDNVASEAQVRPLLPTTSASAALIVSRRRLSALENTRSFEVDVFDTGEAVELLAKVVGEGRVRDEPAAARRIVDLCGNLPLALRVIGARLTARPHWTLERMVRQLDDAHRRLDALATGDRAVRAGIELSYRALAEPARRLFRLLGASTDTDVPAWVAAPLLDLPHADAEELLEELVDARLVDARVTAGTATVRYAMHSLVRLYAREAAAAQEPEADRRAALGRLVGAWLHLADAVQDRLPGGLPRIGAGSAPRHPVPDDVAADALADPMEWFRTERAALAYAIRAARDGGLDEATWELAECFGRFLELSGDLGQWEGVLRQALAVAEAAGNRRGEARMRRALAEIHLDRDEYAAGRAELAAASATFTDLGDAVAAAHAERALGVLERMVGDNAAAAHRFKCALAVFEHSGDVVGQAETLFSLGALRRDQGNYADALALYQRALELETRLGNQLNRVLLLSSMGSALLAEDRVGEAKDVLRRAVTMAREVQQGEAFALAFLGEAEVRSGEPGPAGEHLAAAYEIFQRVDDRYGQALTLRTIADQQRVRGCLDEAEATARRSLALWTELDAPTHRARTLVVLGRVHADRGEPELARAAWGEAADLFERLGTTEAERVRRLLRGMAAG